MAKKQQASPGSPASSLIHPWWNHINIYRGPAVFRKSLRPVPEEVANLYAVHFCHSEVLNGGFLQFYMNDTGVLAPETLRGLRALGLTEAAKLLARTMRRFGKVYPRGRFVRWRVLGVKADGNWPDEDPFEKADDRYYKLLPIDTMRFSKAMDRYAAKYIANKESVEQNRKRARAAKKKNPRVI